MIITVLLIAMKSIGQPMDRTFESANGSLKLLGLASLERLQEAPFDDWYEESYLSYELQNQEIPMPDSITIFMGTWCGDSKRNVPAFIKILENQSFDLEKLKIICLNSGFQNYKQAPEREERGVGIHRVPTFILHGEDGSEIGRIVEEPVVTLEEDISSILTDKGYSPYYAIAQDLLDKLSSKAMKEVQKEKSELIKSYAGKTKNIYELNTLGFVLWTSFQLKKAELVFEINKELYPEEPMVYSSLARLKANLGDNKRAIKLVNQGLAVDPDHKQLLQAKSNLGS